MTSLLVPYDPQWPHRYEEIAAALRAEGNPEWMIEHIGSTAIPGMPAKPIIDVAIRVTDHADVERHRPGLEAAGWRIGSGVRSHPVMVFEESGIRSRIAHLFTAAEWEGVNQRILRDWLRAHPKDAERYRRTKYAAAQDAAEGRARYNAGKTAVIQEIVDRARAARGLPLVAVYDK